MTKNVTLRNIFKIDEINLVLNNIKIHTINLVREGSEPPTSHNTPHTGSLAKINRIMDCLGSLSQMRFTHRLLWLAGRHRPRPGGLGGACTLAIHARVTSARLRPRFRHGHGRIRFVRWQRNAGTQIETPTAALRYGGSVVQNWRLFFENTVESSNIFDEINGCSTRLIETRKTSSVGFRGLVNLVELAEKPLVFRDSQKKPCFENKFIV